jgi:hypothetical protein
MQYVTHQKMLMPNAPGERRPTGENAGNSQKTCAVGRQLHWVVRGLGSCAASHVEGTGPARVLRAILVGSPWVVVTVPALVLCARL